MDSVRSGEALPRSRAWGRAGLAAAVAVLLVSFAELSLWSRWGQAGDLPPVIGATFALAAGAGVLAAVLARWIRPALATALVVAGTLWLFAVHALEIVGVGGRSGLLLSLVLAAAGGAAAGWLSRFRAALAAVALAAVLALVPALVPALVAAWRAQPGARPALPASAPDIVLLVLDTTRRDHLSLYGHPEPTTPGLDELARRAQVYEDAWSVAPWTTPSHASLLTGLMPAEHDADGEDAAPLPPDLVTLTGVLRDGGYRTAGFAANPNLHSAGWSRDFDTYRAPWLRGGHTLVSYLNALFRRGNDPWKVDRTTERVLAGARDWWAANGDGPRFLFMNVLDPHAPYRAPLHDVELFVRGRDCERAEEIARGGIYEYAKTTVTPAERSCVAAFYDAELHAMDRELGDFFAWLAGRGELDRTLVVVTSDHGERLGEGGHVGHLLEMDQHLLRVPLIIRYPPVLAPERIKSRVLLTGLPGFLLELLGLPAPPVMERRSFQETRGTLAVAQHRNFGWYFERIHAADPAFDDSPYRGDWLAVADDRFLLRWSPEQGPESAQLFDYQFDADLKWDLTAERPETVAGLLDRAAHLPAFRVRSAGAERPPLDPELRKRLEALGYAK